MTIDDGIAFICTSGRLIDALGIKANGLLRAREPLVKLLQITNIDTGTLGALLKVVGIARCNSRIEALSMGLNKVAIDRAVLLQVLQKQLYLC